MSFWRTRFVDTSEKVFRDPHEKCPNCHTERATAGSGFALYGARCGHFFCDKCCQRLFSVSPTTPCPKCKAPLAAERMAVKVFADDEDGRVHRETLMRKDVQRVLARSLDDFNSNLSEYNNHLEAVEDLLYDLANGENIESRLADYKIALQHKLDAFAAAKAAAAELERMDTAADAVPVPVVRMLGPLVPQTPMLTSMFASWYGRQAVVAIGGHTAGLGTKRWLQEAYCCLFDGM